MHTVIEQDTTKTTNRRSVVLKPEEHKQLKRYIRGFNTMTEAAESLNVSRQVLERIQLVGSGSPVNIEIIRSKVITIH